MICPGCQKQFDKLSHLAIEEKHRLLCAGCAFNAKRSAPYGLRIVEQEGYSRLYLPGFRRMGLVAAFSFLALAGAFVGDILHEVAMAAFGEPPPFPQGFKEKTITSLLEKRTWMLIGASTAWTIGAWWGTWNSFVDEFQRQRSEKVVPRIGDSERDPALVSAVYFLQFALLFFPAAFVLFVAFKTWGTIVVKSLFWMTECERYVEGALLY